MQSKGTNADGGGGRAVKNALPCARIGLFMLIFAFVHCRVSGSSVISVKMFAALSSSWKILSRTTDIASISSSASLTVSDTQNEQRRPLCESYDSL